MMTAALDYRVRIIRAFGQFSVGRIIDPPGILRERLIKGGFAEPVGPEPKSERKKLTLPDRHD